MTESERRALRHQIDRKTRELIQDTFGPRPLGTSLYSSVPGDWMPVCPVPPGIAHVAHRR